MSEQHAQFKIYSDEAKIPGHQRAWVWGTVALAILLCGVATGWLLRMGGIGIFSASGDLGSQPKAWLAQQEIVNQQLQERIGRLEQALAGNDPCGPAALKALTPSADKL